MKKLLIATNQYANQNKQRVIQLCFDAQSIDKFKPGLKMIFALDDAPLFVKLEEIDNTMTNNGGQPK